MYSDPEQSILTILPATTLFIKALGTKLPTYIRVIIRYWIRQLHEPGSHWKNALLTTHNHAVSILVMSIINYVVLTKCAFFTLYADVQISDKLTLYVALMGWV